MSTAERTGDAGRVLRLWLATDELPVLRSRSAPDPLPRAEATLAAHAIEQGLGGLLHTALAGCWPTVVSEALARCHGSTLRTGVTQLEAAARATELLTRAGQRSLPLSGAALAQRVYASLGERPMRDVELLVLDDWEGSLVALEAGGFRVVARQLRSCRLIDGRTGTVVRLHQALSSCPRLFPLDVEGLWQRSVVDGPGPLPRHPAIEDVLVHLAIRATFERGLVLRLVQVLDIRRLLERCRPDCERLAEAADSAQATLPVVLALRASAQRVGAVLPERMAAACDEVGTSGLRHWLDVPRKLVPGRRPPLMRLRWALTPGRRLLLLRDMLSASPRWGRRSWVEAGTGAAARAWDLAAHWAVPAARALGARDHDNRPHDV